MRTNAALVNADGNVARRRKRMKRSARGTLLTRLAAGLALGTVVAAGLGCAVKQPALPNYPALPKHEAAKVNQNDDARRLGGRLFDKFWTELNVEFVPDDANTPEPDGTGGPFGNGTLPDAAGKPMLNPGHNYRLENLLGWDLHGQAGIAGKRFEGNHCVLLPDLLKNSDPRADWVARITHGEDAIPAYGSVLTSTQIEAVVDFLLGVRDGTLPQPDDLFTLDTQVAGLYRLSAKGDAQRGHALFERTCKGCHGSDGTAITLDDKHSLGTFLRMNASEAWLKVLNGDPGSTMGPQLSVAASRDELTTQLQDLLAAGCDRTRYPKGKASEDVADDDARCGAHLK